MLAGGCGREKPRSSPPPEAAAPASAAPGADVYHARGVVEQLPDANQPDHSIYIHHESLPDFRDRSGKVVGMESMTMPFPVDREMSLESFAAGDTVAFTFEVRWKPAPGFRLTEIRKLPAGTRIDFRAGAAPR